MTEKRVFLAGATGAIGRQLVPLLVEEGWTVAGMTRSAGKADGLRAAGAEPVVCDVFDAAGLAAAVAGFGPSLVMHQLTDLPDDPSEIAGFAGANARIRVEGTGNLIAAAQAAKADRFVAQSVAWPLPGEGGRAVAEHERMVLAIGGVVLRYGMFYGPGTYHEGDAPPDDNPRVAVGEAARRTLELLDAPSGSYDVLD